MKLLDLLRLVAWMFQENHDLAKQKRAARRAGVDPEADEEFRTVNDLD